MTEMIRQLLGEIALGIVIGYTARQVWEYQKARKRRKQFRSAVLKKKRTVETSRNLRTVIRREFSKHNQLNN